MQSPAPPPWARLFLVFAAYWPSFQTGVSYRGRLGVYRVPRRLQSKSCAFQSSLYPFPPPIHPFFSHLHPFLSAASIVRSREASPSISRVVSPFLRPPTTRVPFRSWNPSRDCASRTPEPRHATRVVETRLEDAQDANISSMYARSSLSRIQFRFGRPKPNCLTCRVGRKIMLPAWLLYRRPVLWPISLRSARFLATARGVSWTRCSQLVQVAWNSSSLNENDRRFVKTATRIEQESEQTRMDRRGFCHCKNAK